MLATGEADCKSFADGIVREMMRMMMQAMIIQPLMQAMGFASGGYVGGSTGGGSSYAPDVSGYYASGGYTGDGGKYEPDRKSTRLNSSHVAISYAVFCLKKKIYLYYQL